MQLQITNMCLGSVPMNNHFETHTIKITIITKTSLFIFTKNFTTKKLKISAESMDCGYSLEPPRRGGSNEYPQSMLLSRNKKTNIYPCKLQFYYINVGFKGVYII